MNKSHRISLSVIALALSVACAGVAAKDNAVSRFDAGAISGLGARNIG